MRKEVESQKQKNMELYNIFQYRLQEEEMRQFIAEWREGLERVRNLNKEISKILGQRKKYEFEHEEKGLANLFEENGKREIISITFMRQQKRISKEIMAFLS